MSPYNWNEPARPVDFKESSIAKALKKGPLTAQFKADGVRVHVVISDNAQAFIRSRANIPFPALREIEARLNAPDLRDYRVDLQGCTIEGEGIVFDTDGSLLPCEKTSGALQRLEQLPIGRLLFMHFDTYHDDIKGLDKHRRQMHKRMEAQEMLRRVFVVASLGTFTIADMDSLWACYNSARLNGWEGIVAVKQDEPYASGKKVGAGWKVKPDVTAEGFITGLIEAETPEGKPLGRVGSFEVTYEDGTKGKAGAGAMDHDERRHCWENQEETIGRIAEFSAMEKFAKGGYRHPNWKRWRDTLTDKGVKQ